jgi:hypothetical protein
MHTPLMENRPDEPTLGDLLRSAVQARLATRLLQLLQFARPFAFLCSFLGWRRTSVLMYAISAFGIWPLFERRRQESETEYDTGFTSGNAPERTAVSQRREHPAAHVARIASGTVAATLSVGLALELFLRVMGDAPKL